MASKRSNPLAGKAARDSAAADSAAAEARFQAGRSRALASMNAPEKKPSALQSALSSFASLFGMNPAGKALKK